MIPSTRSRCELLMVTIVFGLSACSDSQPGDAGGYADARADAGNDALPDARVDAGFPDAEAEPDADSGQPDSGDQASWSCVGQVVPPVPSVSESLVLLTFIEANGFVFDGTNAVAAGARVDACPGRDPSCASPVDSDDTNSLGGVGLTVPTGAHGFAGFFRISAAGAAPTVLFEYPPIAHPGVPWAGPWVVPTAADIAAFATTATVTPEAGKGTLLVLTANCHYLDHGPFHPSDTTELAVKANGRAADLLDLRTMTESFFNLDPGPVIVEVSRKSTGDVVGRTMVFVEPDGFSQMVLGPTPLSEVQPESRWSCVGNVAPPAPIISQSTVSLTFNELSTVEGLPLVDARVDACAGRDPVCSIPIATDATDAIGVATLVVPTGTHGFDGFFRVTTASTAPFVLFEYPPIAYGGVPWSGPWLVPEPDDIPGLGATLGLTPVPGKGTLAVLTANCNYLAAPSPTFPRSDTADLFVTAEGRAADDQPANDYYAIFFNLEPGPTIVEVSRKSTGELVGRAVVFVEADGFAQMVLGPTPLP